MKELTQDNEPLPFLTLADATRGVTAKLQNPQSDQRQKGHDKQPQSERENPNEDRLKYVERRMRELAAFEQRAKGGFRRKRK